MVKLKLNAIKSSAPTSEEKPETKENTTPENNSKAKAPVARKKLSISKIGLGKPETVAKVEPVVKSEPVQEEKPQASKPKLSLSSIKAGSKKLEDEKQAELEIQAVIDAEKEVEIFPIGASCELTNIELFPAYTSKFKRKQGGLLEEIKKLKRLPKTNKFFISILIGSTIGVVALLFVVTPEKHNLTYYKTSLLESYDKIKESEIFQEKEPIPQVEEVIVPEIIPEEDDIEEDELDDEVEGEDIDVIEDENSEENDIENDVETYTLTERKEDETDEQYYGRVKQQILENEH